MIPIGIIIIRMQHYSQPVFRALADPTRRQIMMMLREREMTIGEVADGFDVTRAAIKKHLLILERGKLISVHPRGRERVNRLQPDALKPVSEWIDYFSAFWDQRLDNLASAINDEQESEQ